MALVNGKCTAACVDGRSCWHKECEIVKRFTSGKFLLENKAGYVRAAIPKDIRFTDYEANKYSDYNLFADELELDAMLERQIIQNKFKVRIPK